MVGHHQGDGNSTQPLDVKTKLSAGLRLRQTLVNGPSLVRRTAFWQRSRLQFESDRERSRRTGSNIFMLEKAKSLTWSEPLANDLRDPIAAHGDAIERVSDLHRAFLVRDDDQLADFLEFPENQ